MFNIHYVTDTGEIVSYQEGGTITPDAEIPPGCTVLCLPAPIDLSEKMVDIHKKEIITSPLMLIGLGRSKALAAQATTCPPGNFVEVGVYQGGSALFLQAVATNQQRALHLCDTFKGIPDGDPVIDGPEFGSFADTSVAKVQELLPNAIFHVGKFPETIVGKELGAIAFIHADCDLYQSMKDIKTYLWPSVVSGGMIFFDDYDLPGVKQALDEDYGGGLKYDIPTRMMYVIKE